jgi:hypothetical protein
LSLPIGCSIGNLSSGESKEEEEESADKLSKEGNEMVSYFVWKPVEAGQSTLNGMIRITGPHFGARKDQKVFGQSLSLHVKRFVWRLAVAEMDQESNNDRLKAIR